MTEYSAAELNRMSGALGNSPAPAGDLSGNWGDGHKTQIEPAPVSNPTFESRDHSDMTELLEIQDLMKSDINAYFQHPEIPGRYAELLDRVGPPSAAVATDDPHEAAALIDRDVPISPNKYQIDDTYFARGNFRPGDQEKFQEAFNVAYSEGIGQQKLNDAFGFLSSRKDGSWEAFANWAIDRGWPDDHIIAALDMGARHKLWILK